MNPSHIILVDEQDNEIGTVEKLAAHQRGYLHRAFSVFIVDRKGNMLLQQRAFDKYHSGGLWTNACCSHPNPGEAIEAAAHRRLREEMGFQCPLDKLFEFTYHSHLENGLIEHEYDHVFIGIHEGTIEPDPAEVHSYRYSPIGEISSLVASTPQVFTSWFLLAFPNVARCLTDITKVC
ncbi:isopentenyl-diphosphate Delta-isomerase [Taibaiella helva]|uniref:isopentenyl-diphosphate Delta-isomerase n=1 Tax=Taibaiella helva TaxID=2301235 RepID=UPI000E5893F4|nr:isopentenyl-diphosphate Delta-isomerase [Taibaiella helva]